MASAVHRLCDCGWNVILVHGNGPQVGNLEIQQDAAVDDVPRQPLFSVNAMTQGQLGSLLALALHEVGRARHPGTGHPDIAALVTHVVVDPDDPAFARPTKPVGPFFGVDAAERRAARRGWTMVEDAGRGLRRVVASPRPLRIVEAAAVRALTGAGVLVIAAGGGGVPVVETEQGFRQVDAVVDKDHAAQCLASTLAADALVMVTGVRHVMLHYGTPHERAASSLTVAEAEGHLAAGQFAEGSMAPKVRAAVDFVRAGGHTAVITSPELAAASLDPAQVAAGRAGTRVIATSPEEEAAR